MRTVVAMAVVVVTASLAHRRAVLTVAALVVDLVAVGLVVASMTASVYKVARVMTVGLRRVVLAVDAKIVVLLHAVMAKVLAASRALVNSPVVALRHGMMAQPRVVSLLRARRHRSPSREQASLSFRTMPASAQPAPRADRCMKKPAF